MGQYYAEVKISVNLENSVSISTLGIRRKTGRYTPVFTFYLYI